MSQPLRDLYALDSFNDTYALGHYARVVDARHIPSRQSVALKVLRPEHLANNDTTLRWEVRAFPNEADLLVRLGNSPYTVNLLDCGYLSGVGEAPSGGEVVSFGVDVAAYTNGLRDYVLAGWRPYLALELLPRTHNLFYLMRPGNAGTRRRLPTEEGLALALQFAELLRTAHRQRIVYLDHKLEHVFWDGVRLRVIDFNSSKLLAPTAADIAQQFQRDIHNLCVGILYPIFTGLSPVAGALRPQPGGQSDVESRYSDITTLDFGVEPSLSSALTGLLQRGASMDIGSIDAFLSQLQEVAALHGWDFADTYTSPSSRVARAHLRDGLKHLRDGEEHLRQARELFREAAITEQINGDLEAELRRLVKAVGEALNQRVIP
ncbi:MAG: hypothetical protein ACOYL5_04225 [Phototrophicaceae bacterium]|jgi:serine/threonine protein kinase